MTVSRYFALIPAAGVGARLGAAMPKQYVRIAGQTMLSHALSAFARSNRIAHVFVVVGQEDECIDAVLQEIGDARMRVTVLRVGAETRHRSVLNGLTAIREQVGDDDWVLVHDAARPGIDAGLIGKLIDAVHRDATGGLLALPVVDTLKREGADGRAVETVPRERLWSAQTPQMFRYALLRRALEQADGVTDEASAVEALGLKPLLVEGSARNFKVTLPHDVALAELYLKGLA